MNKLVPSAFRSPFLSLEDIRRRADAFRKDHWGVGLPVEVLDILEFEMDMEIVPVQSLKSAVDIDALLMADFRTMAVDRDEYMDARFENRLRFSVGHEIGHLVLHRDIWENIPVASPEDWITFIRDLPEEQWRWLENHANEFAGRLLVPLDIPRIEHARVAARVPDEVRRWAPSADQTRQYLANAICGTFGVSSKVIEHRLQKEGFGMPS